MAGEDKREEEGKTSAVPKRVRRYSVFLILGVVALLAVGIWFLSSWYSARYYGIENLLNESPSPPPIEQRSSNHTQ
jgi:hypothetical protein